MTLLRCARSCSALLLAAGLAAALPADAAPSSSTHAAQASTANAATTATPGAIQAPASNNVTADPLPTVQHNGVAWAQVLVGNTVYVGGNFTAARPAGAAPGTHLLNRANLLSYDITTGRLNPFAPGTNGAIYAMAVTPDHTRLYIGGNFTRAGASTHNFLAAIDLTTGIVDTTFAPVLNAPVHAITATDSSVFVGGTFTVINGASRQRLAAFTRAGSLVSSWAPTADDIVRAMVVLPSTGLVVIGGSFLNLNANPVKGIGAVSSYSGASATWRTNETVYDYGTSAGIYSLTTDGSKVYGTGFNTHDAPGDLEGMFSASLTDGTVQFLEDCHGDTYGALPVNGTVYTVGHAHNCYTDGGWANPPLIFRRAMAFTNRATGTLLRDPSTTHGSHEGVASPSIINWFPDIALGHFTHQNQGAWTIVGNTQYLALGGEFPTVNGIAQQGLVRFAVRPIAPAKVGPTIPGPSATPTATRTSSTSVRVSLPGYWDQDGMTITYQLIRDGNAGRPVASTTASGTFWQLPGIVLDDPSVPPGSHTYRVRGIDADGNARVGRPVTLPAS